MQFIWEQLKFVSQGALASVDGITEEQAVKVPEGYNNNILWNLGHLYVSAEAFALHFAGETPQIPENYNELFSMGTKPADWKVQPPSLAELKDRLSTQMGRIEEILANRLGDKVAEPLTIGPVELKTVAEYLTFTLYHFGIHTEKIKQLCKEL